MMSIVQVEKGFPSNFNPDSRIPIENDRPHIRFEHQAFHKICIENAHNQHREAHTHTTWR